MYTTNNTATDKREMSRKPMNNCSCCPVCWGLCAITANLKQTQGLKIGFTPLYLSPCPAQQLYSCTPKDHVSRRHGTNKLWNSLNGLLEMAATTSRNKRQVSQLDSQTCTWCCRKLETNYSSNQYSCCPGQSSNSIGITAQAAVSCS